MNKDKNNIIKEIQEELGKYLNNNEVKRFCDVLTDGNASQLRLYSTDSAPKDEMKIPEGTDRRAQIDSLITFAHERLPEEKMTELLLRLGELMYYLGEMEISTDMSEEVLSRTNKKEEYESLKAEANLQMARLKWSQGYWDESKSYAQRARKTYSKKNDMSGIARCENMIGTIYGEKGEIKKAKTSFEKALGYMEGSEDIGFKAKIEINLGIIYTMEGKYEEALNSYTESLKIYEDLGERRLQARVLHNLGTHYTLMKKYEEALKKFDESLEVSQRSGYLSNCAIAYLGKAYVFAEYGDERLAEMYTDKALEIAYKLNDTLTIADGYKIKGIIQKNLRNFDFSEELFENSLRLNRDFENKFNLKESSLELNLLQADPNRLRRTQTHLDMAG